VHEKSDSDDIEKRPASSSSAYSAPAGYSTIYPSDTPFFHIDLTGAVLAAESGVGRLADLTHE